MYCLVNGEYQEYDIPRFGGLDSTLERQKNAYAQYIGTVVGDFTVLNVEYDWGKHDQRLECKCNLCGRIEYKYNGSAWRRGKSASQYCKCREEKKKLNIEWEKAKKDFEKSFDMFDGNSNVGAQYGNFVISRYAGNRKYYIKCSMCGYEIKARKSMNEIQSGKAECPMCHKDRYSKPEYIGVRNGHLVSVRTCGPHMLCKCDCGNERLVNPYQYFVVKRYLDCGRSDCRFAIETVKKSRSKREQGAAFEEWCTQVLVNAGYKIKLIGKTGDYGVDIIAIGEDGKKIAVQCKNSVNCESVGVNAIQEVYAGGRFYDINRFAVMTNSEYSKQAMKMAKVLGVYLYNKGDFVFPVNICEYSRSIMPICSDINEANKKYYEINGVKKTLVDWCCLYGISETSVRNRMKHGLSLESALTCRKQKIYDVNGTVGTIAKICREYGMIPATVSYRMKHRGMSLEEALEIPTKKYKENA